MTLSLNLLSEQEWVLGRTNQPGKLHNSHFIGYFNNAITAIKDSIKEGSVFYNNVVPTERIDNNSLIYEETSPYVNLFSLAPKSYYIKDPDFLDLWNFTDIDSTIIETFDRIPSSKYINSSLEYALPNRYILFAMQSDSQQLTKNYNKRIVEKTLQFARDKKINILFKLHPFTNYRTRFLQDLRSFKEQGLLSSYAHILSHKYNTSHLINNADQVWTFSSGVALQAVIANKKTVCFSTDNTFGPAVVLASSPEEAFYSNDVCPNTILRFLTWYYHKICLDLHNSNFQSKLYERCDNFFNKKLPMKLIFT